MKKRTTVFDLILISCAIVCFSFLGLSLGDLLEPLKGQGLDQDNPSPVDQPAVEARTYNKLFPRIVMIRVDPATREGRVSSRMVPYHTASQTFLDQDMRCEVGDLQAEMSRSPVVQRAIRDIVSACGLLTREQYWVALLEAEQALEEPDPAKVTLYEGKIAAVQTLLEIE